MNRQEIIDQIRLKKTFLCIGLDTDISMIPRYLLDHPDPVLSFNKAIIDATHDLCVAYKINTAFYESMGSRGWQTLEKTVEHIPAGIFRIADAKRGDIGNTSLQYAKAFFETLPFDAVTIAPYMGADSVQPFLSYPGKWGIVLALTSNPGARDFEMLQSGDEFLYEKVIRKAMSWGTPGNLMFVVGATRSEWFSKIREICPDNFFLVPGVGAQGGSLSEIATLAMNTDIGVLVNVSRTVIYASNQENFAARAREAAMAYRVEMEGYLGRRK
ncbi:MAG TPA: orotidine-5'-phosphate decarboxylase [Chitinophagaceae bacterium]|nr:orotidine-5'-phosphate decarboxylase [Chitinophagaceae bacterium]